MANPSDQDVAIADKLTVLPNTGNVRRDAIAEAVADAYAAGIEDREKGASRAASPDDTITVWDLFAAAAIAADETEEAACKLATNMMKRRGKKGG